MRAHVIESNLVVNTVEVESLDFMPNLILATDGGIGWSFVDGVLIAPVGSTEKFVPQSVSAYQAKAALFDFGIYDLVNSWINSDKADFKTKLVWENAGTFNRNSHFLEKLAPKFNLTDDQIDSLFIAAHEID
tara:strand:- start:812 stop:1207 length:396 start_codon:yes stop_codon:yes gene_type:complete